MRPSFHPTPSILLTSLLCSLISVWSIGAAIPSGMISYPAFTSPKLWDVAGPYHVQQNIGTGGGPIDLEFDINAAQDAKGKLSGTGAATVTIDTEMVPGTYTVKGSVK